MSRSEPEQPLAIYRRPGKYLVKRFSPGEPGLWAILGPEYTRETADALAVKLAEELPGRKLRRLGHEYSIHVDPAGDPTRDAVIVTHEIGTHHLVIDPCTGDPSTVVPVVELTLEQALELGRKESK